VVGLIVVLIRAVTPAVRDDEISSATIRGPGARTLAIIGAQSAKRRRRHAQPPSRADRERRSR
jgi:hypothetical protein